MGVSKFVLKLRLYKDEQKSEIFCSSFESASYRIPSNIKLTFRTFTAFSPKTPKNLLSVHFSIANYAQTECQFRYCGTAIPFLTVRSTAR